MSGVALCLNHNENSAMLENIILDDDHIYPVEVVDVVNNSMRLYIRET